MSAASTPASAMAARPGPQRQIAVEDPAVGAAALAPPAELVVQPPLMDAEVFDDPLGLEGPAVRANGTKVLENLLVGDPAVRQVRPDARNRDRHADPNPGIVAPAIESTSYPPRAPSPPAHVSRSSSDVSDRPNRGGSPSLHLVSRIEPQLTTL